MYRRISIATDNPLVEVCRKHGYPLEYKKNLDGTDDFGTTLVTFPYSHPEGTPLASEMTALTQLSLVKLLQSIWSDNSVSCTVYYKKEEIPTIKEYLRRNYRYSHKTLSFLLHQEHGFIQAPLEEVSEAQYRELCDKTEVITEIGSVGEMGLSDDECEGGVCPVR